MQEIVPIKIVTKKKFFKMSSCPKNMYYSSFLDTCVECPDLVQKCHNESPIDAQSCSRYCAGNVAHTVYIVALFDLLDILFNLFV